MTLAISEKDRDRVRKCFALLYRLREKARTYHDDIRELSMGMSGDFEDAIREGADVIRLGQLIFGERPTSDAYYWPNRLKQIAQPE